MGFVFTNFQADNYGTSSGDDEGICRVLAVFNDKAWCYGIERTQMRSQEKMPFSVEMGPETSPWLI